MRTDSYGKLVEKRERIAETTLIVGADIGNNFNALGLMDKKGKVLKKLPKVYNSCRGFKYYRSQVESIMKKHGFKDVIVGMEPTGHYWRKIAYYSLELGYEVRFVKTTALKHQRELDESSPDKCDMRDAVTICNLVREGKYIDSQMPAGVYRQLRTLGKVRERIMKYHTGTKHALKAVLDDYFPELKDIFWSMSAKGLWGLLEECPFPEDVLKKGEERIAEIIAVCSRRRESAREKAARVFEAAGESVGLKDIGIADRYRVKIYLEELKRAAKQLKDIEKEMGKLLNQLPDAKILLSIAGIGKLSAAVFFGELGNPENFAGYKQMVKYAGYDPMRRDSGMRVGRSWISKKGRYLLRKFLYFMAMRVVHRSKYFKEYYERKKEAENRFGEQLKKKEALCAVVIKLIKVLFALLRDKREFQESAPERKALAA